MKKKLISALLLFCCTVGISEELKVSVLSFTEVKYTNCPERNGMNCKYHVKILCVDGYRWLQFGYNNGSISQMFEPNINGLAKPIKCEN